MIGRTVSRLVYSTTRFCAHRYSSMASNVSPAESGTGISDENPTDVDEKQNNQGIKRSSSPPGVDVEDSPKKQKTCNEEMSRKEAGLPYKKKKMALIMMYSGKGYYGMQLQREDNNLNYRTIESDLLEALVKAGVITKEHAEEPGRNMRFQRAARTDKGVSAAGQVCSLMMFTDHAEIENPVEKINTFLPPQIRVLGIKRATKNFDSKNACDSRTYSYLLPTFALCPIEENVVESFRIKEEILKRTNEILSLYRGTHNFHNYTSGKKPSDPSAKRYIIDMRIGEAFVQNDLEFAVITVHGQSFMLHQIRKMIGLVIAIIRGLANISSIEESWQPLKVDVPRAPGLGLMLEQCHYDAYSNRYAKTHEKLSYEEYKDEINMFKKEYIYKTMVETEKTERSMLEWLATLHYHHFGVVDTSVPIEATTTLGRAQFKIKKRREAEKSEMENSSAVDTKDNDKESNSQCKHDTQIDSETLSQETHIARTESDPSQHTQSTDHVTSSSSSNQITEAPAT